MRRSQLMGGVGVILCACGLTHGSIEIKQYNASGTQVGSTITQSSGVDFSITIGSTDVRSIVVRSTASNPSSESVGRITVSDDAWGNDIKLYIAQRSNIQDAAFYNEPDDPACSNWAGVEDQRDSGNLDLKANIGGNLTGTIIGRSSGGTTNGYTRLNTLEVGGAINAKVYAQAGLYRVRCNEAPRLNGATAFWSDGDIGLIQATNGDIDCDVIANKGGSSTTFSIDRIDAPEGSIGTNPAVAMPTISIGTTGTANVQIKQLTAKHGIHANIAAPQGIALLKTTGVMVGDELTEGDVTGTITTNKLINQSLTEGGLFDVAGSLEAAVTLTAELPANAKIAVGKYLGDQSSSTTTPAITIQGNAQLKGNIVIDQFNPVFNQINWQLWNRPVVVERPSSAGGNITLGPASDTRQEWYSYTSAQLGGGAVGLPPFNVNLNDCVPPGPLVDPDYPEFLQSEFNHASGITQKSIRLRFYGPVKSDGLGTPIEIDHFGPFYGGFINPHPHDVTSKFVVTVNPVEPSGERAVLIEGKQDLFYYPGFYIIYGKQPDDFRPGRILSDTPTQLPVTDITYGFWIHWDCDGNGVNDAVDVALHPELDQNHDGLLDSCDRPGWCIADFIDDGFVNGDDYDFFMYVFELGDIWADINGDGFITGQDFDAFAEAFEAGC